MKAKLLGVGALIITCALSLGAANSALAVSPDNYGVDTRNQTNVGADSPTSTSPDISSDGLRVVFVSTAVNLGQNSTANNFKQIYVKDTAEGSTQMLSDPPTGSVTGSGGNGDSTNPRISSNGQYVVYQSDASDLRAGDINNASDIFMYDINSNNLILISKNAAGEIANGASQFADVSNDGKYVTFSSRATNLVSNPQVTDGQEHVYLKNTQNGDVILLSKSSNGNLANASSTSPKISCDGQYVAFVSNADNLVKNDTTNSERSKSRIYLTNTTQSVSPIMIGNGSDGNSTDPRISCNGQYVAFNSTSSDLVPNDTNGKKDVFVYNKSNNALDRESVNNNGSQISNDSNIGGLSDDGNYIAFATAADDVVFNDSNGKSDIFLRNRLSNTTQLASKSANGDAGNDESNMPAMKGSANYIAYRSDSTNLQSNFTGRIYKTETTVGQPQAPNNLRATSPTQTAVLSWDSVPSADSYNIYHDYRFVATSNTTSYTDTITQESGRYYVKAVKDGIEGNQSHTLYVSIDRTPPTITARFNAGKNSEDWYSTPLTISFVCQDNSSDTGYISDCPASKTFNEGANQSYSGTSKDAAGNITTYSISGINVDTTSPTFGMPTLSNSVINQGESATVSIPILDNLSGMKTITNVPGYSLDGNPSLVQMNFANGIASGTISGLNPGKHTIAFKAIDVADNFTKTQDAPTTTITVLPNAPTNFSAVSPTMSAPVLNWSAVPRVGIYYVYRDGSLVGVTQNTTYTDMNTNEGTHYYYVTTQTEGVESQPSTMLQVIYDKTKPSISYAVTPDANNASWNTSDVMVTFNCVDYGSGVASCPSPVTVSGEDINQTVSGTVIDNAGNTASVTTRGINIDKTAPVASTPSLSANIITTTGQVSLTIPVTDNLSGVARGEYYEGNDPGRGAATALTYTNGNATVTFNNLSAGMHTINYRAKDVAGNWSAVAYVTITVKPLAPTSISSSAITKNAPVISWNTVSGITRYTIQRDGNQIDVATVTSSTANYTDASAPEGSHVYTIKALTTDNVTSDDSNAVTALYDKTAPVTGTATLSTNPITTANQALLSVTVTDNLSGVARGEFYEGNDPGVGAGTVMVYSDGKLTAPLNNLSAGIHTFKYRAKDIADNWSSPVTITLTVKPLAPTNVTALSPTKNAPTLQWGVINGAARYSVQRDGSQIGTTTTTNYADTAANEGTHTYTVKAIASDGTASDESVSISVLYDKTAPTASAIVLSGNGYTHFNGLPPLIPASDTVTRTATVTITASAIDSLSGVASGEYYLDTDPGQSNGIVMTFANGKVTAQLKASNYSTGSHTIYVRSKDAAGNWSTVTSFKINII